MAEGGTVLCVNCVILQLISIDVTDKFDYTFLCGDLNFRLDISRLHADWLIARQGTPIVWLNWMVWWLTTTLTWLSEWTRALAFDQLRNIMQSGEAFVGFNEGPIEFPPTFKYDVLRTIKKGKRKSSTRKNWRLSAENLIGLAEAEERDMQEADDDDEAASIASTVLTSVHSKLTTMTDVEDDYDDSSNANGFAPGTPGSSTGPAKLSISLAAINAKRAWKALVSPSAPDITSPNHKSPRFQSAVDLRPSSDLPSSPASASSPRLLLPPLPHARQSSPSSPGSSSAPPCATDADEVDRGVYDSSSKRRVPSWCGVLSS
jgi:hypothetical protein